MGDYYKVSSARKDVVTILGKKSFEVRGIALEGECFDIAKQCLKDFGIEFKVASEEAKVQM